MEDQELEKLKEEIKAKEAAQAKSAESSQTLAQVSPSSIKVQFNPTLKKKDEPDKVPVELQDAKKGSAVAGEMVNTVFEQGVVHVVSTNEGVQNQILDTAEKVVRNKAEAIANQTTKEAQISALEVNRDACENYGVSKDVSLWKVGLMKAGSAFWFVVYFIIASLTIAPITVFMKGLLGSVKKIWLAIIIAIVFYLFIVVGIPLLTYLIPKS